MKETEDPVGVRVPKRGQEEVSQIEETIKGIEGLKLCDLFNGVPS